MKCSLCKYKNAALEAERHTNGTTIYIAEALRRNLKENRTRTCEAHGADFQAAYSTDLEIAHKALETAKMAGYMPIDMVWYKPVYLPKGERQ